MTARWDRETRIVFSGDVTSARALISLGRKLMGHVKEFQSFRKLPHAVKRFALVTGAVITIYSGFGLDTIRIFVPEVGAEELTCPPYLSGVVSLTAPFVAFEPPSLVPGLRHFYAADAMSTPVVSTELVDLNTDPNSINLATEYTGLMRAYVQLLNGYGLNAGDFEYDRLWHDTTGIMNLDGSYYLVRIKQGTGVLVTPVPVCAYLTEQDQRLLNAGLPFIPRMEQVDDFSIENPAVTEAMSSEELDVFYQEGKGISQDPFFGAGNILSPCALHGWAFSYQNPEAQNIVIDFDTDTVRRYKLTLTNGIGGIGASLVLVEEVPFVTGISGLSAQIFHRPVFYDPPTPGTQIRTRVGSFGLFPTPASLTPVPHWVFYSVEAGSEKEIVVYSYLSKPSDDISSVGTYFNDEVVENGYPGPTAAAFPVSFTADMPMLGACINELGDGSGFYNTLLYNNTVEWKELGYISRPSPNPPNPFDTYSYAHVNTAESVSRAIAFSNVVAPIGDREALFQVNADVQIGGTLAHVAESTTSFILQQQYATGLCTQGSGTRGAKIGADGWCYLQEDLVRCSTLDVSTEYFCFSWGISFGEKEAVFSDTKSSLINSDFDDADIDISRRGNISTDIRNVTFQKVFSGTADRDVPASPFTEQFVNKLNATLNFVVTQHEIDDIGDNNYAGFPSGYDEADLVSTLSGGLFTQNQLFRRSFLGTIFGNTDAFSVVARDAIDASKYMIYTVDRATAPLDPLNAAVDVDYKAIDDYPDPSHYGPRRYFFVGLPFEGA